MAQDLLNLLEQAQIAGQQRRWTLVVQYLQLLASEGFTAVGGQPSGQADDYLQQILALALEGLVAGNFSERWAVAKAFPQIGLIAIDPLIEILQDVEADLESRWFAARILGEFDQPGVVTALVALLQTSVDEDLTTMAAEALAKLGNSAIAVLTDLLTEEKTRLLAVRSLAQIRRSETITPLISVVHDAQVAVRATAIEAIGSFHDPQVPPVLIQALTDPAAQVRRAALFGLGFRPDLAEELDLVTVIQPLLKDVNLDVCSGAAIALGRLGTDAAPALAEVLQSSFTPAPLQVTIVSALSWIETPQSLEYLRQALAIPSLPLVQEVVTTLGRVTQPNLMAPAAKILIAALNSQHLATQSPTVKQAIALSLGQLAQPQAIQPLIELLADPDTRVRLHAIAALKRLAARHHLEDLVNDQQISPGLREGVVIALAEW